MATACSAATRAAAESPLDHSERARRSRRIPARTGSLAFYLVPTPLDVPEIECLIVEVPDPNGPYGAKGVSEPATIPTTPAILNAIYDAVGVRVLSTPATPERVFDLLRAQEAQLAASQPPSVA